MTKSKSKRPSVRNKKANNRKLTSRNTGSISRTERSATTARTRGAANAATVQTEASQSSGDSATCALALHRQFLQDVLSEVISALSTRKSLDDRLVAALHAYWGACFARREVRRHVLSLIAHAKVEVAVEPLGRPFFHMIVSELTPTHGSRSNALAATIYNEARAIAVAEATHNEQFAELRQKVIEKINADMSI